MSDSVGIMLEDSEEVLTLQIEGGQRPHIVMLDDAGMVLE